MRLVIAILMLSAVGFSHAKETKSARKPSTRIIFSDAQAIPILVNYEVNKARLSKASGTVKKEHNFIDSKQGQPINKAQAGQ